MEKKKYYSSDELPAVLSSEDVANYLQISKSSVYELARTKDFNCFRIGNRVLITKENLLSWMDLQMQIAS